jgi:hypothetical protein
MFLIQCNKQIDPLVHSMPSLISNCQNRGLFLSSLWVTLAYRWHHIQKDWNYKTEAQQFLSDNNFKHLIKTIMVKTCNVMWKTRLLKSCMEGHVAHKVIDQETFSNKSSATGSCNIILYCDFIQLSY